MSQYAKVLTSKSSSKQRLMTLQLFKEGIKFRLVGRIKMLTRCSTLGQATATCSITKGRLLLRVRMSNLSPGSPGNAG